tara:strand:+ start:13872 stop:14912 length:1041 start_codon:yes stop_codon:yes gene_type:complete
MKFPREVWAGSHLEGASQPKRIVVDENQFKTFVSSHNGKMNVYTTVYDFKEYLDNRGLEHTAILDRIFLDIDAHNNNLEEAFDVCIKLHNWLKNKELMHTICFSGRGFYIFVLGEICYSIRKIKAFFNVCHDIVNHSECLDKSVINVSRLRRVVNTYNFKGKRFCIRLQENDLKQGLEFILNEAKKPRDSSYNQSWGSEEINWPDVKAVEISEVEITEVESIGKIPILPCLKEAIMIENPTHRTRYLLVQWYSEFLSEMAIIENSLNCSPREIRGGALDNISLMIEEEIENISNYDNIWIDYDRFVTRDQVRYIVDRRYMAPSCDTLICEDYCIGKCWRYPNVDDR